MKLFLNKENTKKIVVLIVIVMLFNFISPTISQAVVGAFFEKVGGALFEPVAEFLCIVADLFLRGLQRIFVGAKEIAYGLPGDAELDMFMIRYSPGIIFSNKVAGLKTNFINATKEDNEQVISTVPEYIHIADTEPMPTIETTLGDLYNSEEDSGTVKYSVYADPSVFDGEKTEVDYMINWVHEGKNYFAICKDIEMYAQDYFEIAVISVATGILAKTLLGGLATALLIKAGMAATLASYAGPILVFAIAFGIALVVVNWIFNNNTETTDGKFKIYEIKEKTEINEEKESNALLLQPTVATWYKALRAIALVGLLSVLVYVGIRILISSTARRKSKI